jgi:hypothetical protein
VAGIVLDGAGGVCLAGVYKCGVSGWNAVKFFNSELQSNSNIASPFVDRNSWRYIEDDGKSEIPCNKALLFTDFHGRLMRVALCRGLTVFSEVRVIEKLYFNVRGRGGGGISCYLFEGGQISISCHDFFQCEAV